MEVLAAVSLVGNLIQFLDLGSKIVTKSAQLYRTGEEALAENIDIEATTQDLVYVNERLKKQSEYEVDDVLHRLCNSCKLAAAELLMIIDKLKVKDKSHRKTTSIAKAIKSLYHKDQIESLERRLAGYRAELNLHISMQIRNEILLLKQQHPALLEGVDVVTHRLASAIAEQQDIFESGLNLQLHDLKISQDLIAERIEGEGKMSRELMKDMNEKLDVMVLPYLLQMPAFEEKAVLNQLVAGLSGKIKAVQQEPLVDPQRLQEWLKPMSTEDKWTAARSAQVPGTSEWIVRKEAFQQWALPADVSGPMKVLWIHGGPGFGKTVLCASILEHLKNLHPSHVAYFFCISDDEARRKPITILRSWVSQLIHQEPEALEIAQEFYKRLNNAQGYQLRAEDLWQILTKICQRVPDVFLVVDGFDECVRLEKDTKHYSNESESFLEQLVDSVAKTSGHLLLVSREDSEVRLQFRRLAEIAPGALFEHELSHSDTQDVMSTFALQAFSKRLRRQDQQVKIELANIAAQRSQGMFLWVQLLVNRLKQDRPAKELRKIVLEAPVEINIAYENDLRRIMDLGDERDRAVAILRWTFFAQRPLSVRELTEALAIDLEDDTDEYPADNLPDTWDEEDVNDRIRRLGGALIELRNDDNNPSTQAQTVHFVHFSVKEYLLAVGDIYRQSPKNAFFSELNLEHDLLSRLCLRYLTYKEVVGSKAGNADLSFPVESQYKFLQYAASHWATHANNSTDWSGALFARVCGFFEEKSQACQVWAEMYEDTKLACNPNVTGPPTELKFGTPVYYASVLGFHPLLKVLMENGQQANGAGPFYGCALAGAAGRGHLPCVKLLLEHNADVNLLDGLHRSALGWASRHNHHEIARLLIEQHASINNLEDEQFTPLLRAASEGHLEMVKLLLNEGADLYAMTTEKQTALHLAARGGYLDIVRFLLTQGLKVSCKAQNGWTALLFAANNDHVDVTKVLLENGANVDAQSSEGTTSLLLAAQSGYLGVVDLLLEYGANVDLPTNSGSTPFYSASAEGFLDILPILRSKNANIHHKEQDEGWDALHAAAVSGHLQVAKYLISLGMDVNRPDKDLWTPCHLAAHNKQPEVLNLLLESGAKLDSVNSGGRTPFVLAAKQGDCKSLQVLLEHHVRLKNDGNSDIEPADGSNHCKKSMGLSPEAHETLNAPSTHEDGNILQIAAFEGSLELLKNLVDNGVDVNSKELASCTAIHCAAYSGRAEIIEFLIARGACVECSMDNGQTALSIAASNGHEEIVKLLIASGADVDKPTVGGRTALHRAVQNNHIESALILIEHHADINAVSVKGRTPLWTAARYGHFPMLKLLIEQGARTDTVDLKGETLLYLAAYPNCTDMLKYLLDLASHDLNQGTANGQTPLWVAAEKGCIESVKLLLERGAEIEKSDRYCWTPLHAASSSGHVEIIKLLVSHNAKLDLLDRNGRTAVGVAAKYGELEAVKHLIFEQNQPWDIRTKAGSTCLHTAVVYNRFSIINFFLSELNVSIDIADRKGCSLLYLAVNKKNLGMVRFLIDKGADVNLREESDFLTPLHAAVQCNELQIVMLLVEKGADLQAKTKEGLTPLHTAANSGHVEIASWLIQAGADLLAETNSGSTFAECAVQLDDIGIVKLIPGCAVVHSEAEMASVIFSSLVEADTTATKVEDPAFGLTNGGHTIGNAAYSYCSNGASDMGELQTKLMSGKMLANRSLWTAAKYGRLEIVQFLAEHGADVESIGFYERTPLHMAASWGRLAVVKYLIEEKKVNINAVGQHGNTALGFAAWSSKIRIVNYLVDEAHADINIRNTSGRTSLSIAVWQGNLEIIKFLISKAKDVFAAQDPQSRRILLGGPDEQDYTGHTMLHTALGLGHSEIVDVLLESGADPLIPDGFGMTSMDWVVANATLTSRLKSCCKGESPREVLPRKRILSDTICHFARKILKYKDRTAAQGFYELGNALKFFDDLASARVCFQQRISKVDGQGNLLQPVICGGCGRDIFPGDRFVCLTCPDTDLCSACMPKYNEEMHAFCRNHEFFKVESPKDAEKHKKLPKTISEDIEEFLRQLLVRYTPYSSAQ